MDLLPPIPPKSDDLRFRDLPHRSSFEGNGFGVVTRKGKKMFMDDSYVTDPCFDGSSKKSFFGVYDGHGDGKAVKYVADNLHKNVLEMMKNCKEGKEEKEEALKAAYLKTDRDFLEKDFKSGACCVTVLIQDQEIIVSNLGDCRAVLCRGGVAVALTSDHKAGREDERQRIKHQAWRVAGALAVSRSIGDADLKKKKWVIAEPETRVLEIEEDMEFLVIASDGLWDVVNNQEAVETVLKALPQGKTLRESEYENLIQGFDNLSPFPKRSRLSLVQEQKEVLPVESPKPEKESPDREIGTSASKSGTIKAACKKLVDMAVSKGSRDDITVMIVDLNRYKC
ncbi:unnamed protein product [Microthlaspi erraticum]|uniref:protein-serine/threonine phosphatase n=1 Tax=Microthlaspi erraticum TaxID=1685480 RepID=A0A6D2KY90_9BRAS|nr:unnamed protein product [Microthlaspi erraticum]